MKINIMKYIIIATSMLFSVNALSQPTICWGENYLEKLVTEKEYKLIKKFKRSPKTRLKLINSAMDKNMAALNEDIPEDKFLDKKQVMRQQNRTKVGGSKYVLSVSEEGTNWSAVEFSKEKWNIINVQREPGKKWFMNDLIRRQILKAITKDSKLFPPKIISIDHILNPETITAIGDFKGVMNTKHLVAFLKSPLGKLSTKVLDDIGFKIDKIVVRTEEAEAGVFKSVDIHVKR